MSLEVHTTFCVQIGGKSRIACERVVSRGQSSVCRWYEHFARVYRKNSDTSLKVPLGPHSTVLQIEIKGNVIADKLSKLAALQNPTGLESVIGISNRPVTEDMSKWLAKQRSKYWVGNKTFSRFLCPISIAGDSLVPWEQLKINNTFEMPPNTQHNLLLMNIGF